MGAKTRLCANVLSECKSRQHASSGQYQKLYEVLFPGSSFSWSESSKLAKELHKVADEISMRKESLKRVVAGNDKKEKKRELNFSKYRKRHVALDLLYQGFDYHGFASQSDIESTVEEELFRALRKTRLVPEGLNWKEMRYSRGGRTDKGVSAAGQVVALEVRSKGLIEEDEIGEDDEYDYASILNRALSSNIKVTGWKTVPHDFSARFDAKYREYKYFFVQNNCDLDLTEMKRAAKKLQGEHDFRNFCKADIPTVKSFKRTILSADVYPSENIKLGRYQGIVLHIKGTAFLWHQIRCIAAILSMVGKRLESAEIIDRLLDIHATPEKPQYLMASEQPLLLYGCHYGDLNFLRSSITFKTISKVITKDIQSLLTKSLVLMTIQERLNEEFQMQNDIQHEDRQALQDAHIPLLKRHREPNIDERLMRYYDKIPSHSNS